MRTLLIDIETRPNLSYHWGVWRQNIRPHQIVESAEVICFSAKWLGEDTIYFFSTYHHGKQRMVQEAFEFLNEADVVVHFNGSDFDIPWLQTEIQKQIGRPPSPYRNVDCYRSTRKVFKLNHYSLNEVAKEFGLIEKTEHEGFEMWLKCLLNDPGAWADMREYNMRDVAVLEELLLKVLLPWIPNFPNAGLYSDSSEEEQCPACQSRNLVREGYAYTALQKYQRFRCRDCGKWSRGRKALSRVELRSVAS